MSGYNLKKQTADILSMNDTAEVVMNYIGLVHVYLPTLVILFNCYILFIKNWALGDSNVLTNWYFIVLFGQTFICFGRQIQYLYYLYVNTRAQIFGTLIMQSIGVCLNLYGWIALALTYYYIGIKNDHTKYNEIIVRKVFPVIFSLIPIIIGISYFSTNVRFGIESLLTVTASTVHGVMYYKLKNTVNPFVNAETNGNLYKIGLFGAILYPTTIILSILIGGISMATGNDKALVIVELIGTLFTGISYATLCVGIVYLSWLKVFDMKNNNNNKDIDMTTAQISTSSPTNLKS